MGKTSKIKKLEGIITGLERELTTLAPCPDLPLSSLAHSFQNALIRDFRVNAYDITTRLAGIPRRESLKRRIDLCRRRLAILQNKTALFTDNFALAA